ncbi:Cilia- and flagella-associated protein 43 [Gonapodya sp. JEL0774]|nr:Cilia- and flagella-associated protein 43 [Gonapodya sp. JEL0774]
MDRRREESGLYGELELSRSLTITPSASCAPIWLTNSLIAYPSSNAIVFMSTANLQGAGSPQDFHSSAPPVLPTPGTPRMAQQELKPVLADSIITCMAHCKKENTLVFAERGTTDIKSIKIGAAASSAKIVLKGQLILLSEGSCAPVGWVVTVYEEVARSNRATPRNSVLWDAICGLDALGLIYHERLTNALLSLIGAAPTDISLLSLAFSPGEVHLASLGDLPGFTVTVWDWKRGTAMCQRKFPTVLRFRPALHYWTPQHTVLATSLSADILVEYNPKTGLGETVASARVRPTNKEQTEDNISLDEVVWGRREVNFEEWPQRDAYVGAGGMGVVGITSDHLIVGGKEGTLHWLIRGQEHLSSRSVSFHRVATPPDPESFSYPEKPQPPPVLTSLSFSPDYSSMFVTSLDGRAFIIRSRPNAKPVPVGDSDGGRVVLMRPGPTMSYVQLFSFVGALQPDAVDDPATIMWLAQDPSGVPVKVAMPGSPSCLAVSPCGLTMVGSSKGVVRVYDTYGVGRCEVSLVWRSRVCKNPVKWAEWSSGGEGGSTSLIRRYLAFAEEVPGGDSRVWILRAEQTTGVHGSDTRTDEEATKPPMGSHCRKNNISILGYLSAGGGTFQGLAWSAEPVAGGALAATLYAVTAEDQVDGESTIYKWQLSTGVLELSGSIAANMRIGVHALSFKVKEQLRSFAVVTHAGNPTLVVATTTHRLLHYHFPVVDRAELTSSVSPSIRLGPPVADYPDTCHSSRPGGRVLSAVFGRWIVTWSTDGTLFIRNLEEPERPLKVSAFPLVTGGVRTVAVSRDGKAICVVGEGGAGVRVWDWKFSPAGKRDLAEVQSLMEQLIPKDVPQVSRLTEEIRDSLDSLEEESVAEKALKNPEEEEAKRKAKETTLKQRVLELSAAVQKAISRNEDPTQCPDLERLGKEEFIIHFAERDALEAESRKKLEEVRRAIELENIKMRIIQQRIKTECWDAMAVPGETIRSFNQDPLTQREIEVSNYPIRKKTATEIKQLNKIKLLRSVSFMVQKKFKKDREGNSGVEMPDSRMNSPGGALSSQSPLDESFNISSVSLLYPPLELTSDDRRKAQITILLDVVEELKTNFNAKFAAMAKLKRDEISKIEEKNDRVTEILTELGIAENVFHPVLDDNEVPERVLSVEDSEIKVEKWISEEEQQILNERRKEEEERIRRQKEDDSRERALFQMMGGKLEDRSNKEDKEEVLVKPDWMNKPVGDMTEDERKQVKEYEKKAQMFKEEQEKYRKALETELRKLQSSISEACIAFDDKLREFSLQKLTNNEEIYKKELQVVHLQRAIILTEDDSTKEEVLLARIEKIKRDKAAQMEEAPMIKKDLDKAKEEHEQAIKRDKEIDKQFKKEFSSFEFYLESLSRLFKRRDAVNDQENTRRQVEELNPFLALEPILVGPQDISVAPLNSDKDMPDGLPSDVWNKLVELRDRKIASESELRTAARKLSEIQSLLDCSTREADRLRTEADQAAADLSAFKEHRVEAMYDVEMLLGFKQGQVEVPQAAVVTDFSDAILIDRKVVEDLNDSIVAIGKSKVTALQEMKDYRKGIHALEWENKMLDFQAEDQAMRIRDIQLLRVTKQMQEFIRSGDDHRRDSELARLEKRAEHGAEHHAHKVAEKLRQERHIKKRIKDKEAANMELDVQLRELELAVDERRTIWEQTNHHSSTSASTDPATTSRMQEIYHRRRLADLAKANNQEILSLKNEVERLRLKTYPAFPAK